LLAPCIIRLAISSSFVQKYAHRTLLAAPGLYFPNFANMRERKKPYLVPDELRTRIMRSNKSHGNFSTELTLARLMRANRISGWRRRVLMTGRPDFVFKQQRVALFIDGCYWHGCKCRRLPKKNREYWEAKFRDNQARDKRITRDLRAGGWHVIRIWEHQLKHKPDTVVKRIAHTLTTALYRDGGL
jgi:DNA mismatch endonuclease (patch repair protein)